MPPKSSPDDAGLDARQLTPHDRHAVTERADALARWVASAGWAGWDPYDVRAHPVYLAVSRAAARYRPFRLPLGAFYHFEQRHPRAARRLFRASPAINAKGMGLFARAAHLRGDADDADARVRWLLDHAGRSGDGIGWGYPFDWQSDVFIPRGTPSSVVTCTVADALRERADRPDERDALRAIARFLMSLRRTPSRAGHGHCFSYTPIDRFCVLNASLMSAEYLTWAGDTFDEPSWREAGTAGVDYVLAAQEPDGTWDYWGPEHERRPAPSIDPYHTGFVLRFLVRYHDATGDPAVRDAIVRGYRAFHERLFDGPRPRHTLEREYPVNIHAVAEGILTHQAVRHLDPEALGRALELFAWAERTMSAREGFYTYLWSPTRENRLPMMRWGQAWMLLALTALASPKRIS